VSHFPATALLQSVSRSFYLTLRLLPGPMRGAASLAYLLARTSDTLADTPGARLDLRRDCLQRFGHAIADSQAPPRWPIALINAIADPQERRLLEGVDGLFLWLGHLPECEADLVREVLSIIIRGQESDLERFAETDPERPAALADDAALEDYTCCVAGCVGAFWTQLGFLTLKDRFSRAPANILLERGITYGKGLQLVNILRDLSVDLANGRCYLPVADPHDTPRLLEARDHWLEQAWEWVGAGFDYADTLVARRLRVATVLPAMLARETLTRLRGSVPDLQTRIKVPRSRVYLALARASLGLR
jgi:farnesyl-diphosphate farnesyltransferase